MLKQTLRTSNKRKILNSFLILFIKENISDKSLVFKTFEEYKPTIVVNLAAQAGVRYSITNPNTLSKAM